jgi:hypothetical protein
MLAVIDGQDHEFLTRPRAIYLGTGKKKPTTGVGFLARALTQQGA